jgi:hypothetical protein
MPRRFFIILSMVFVCFESQPQALDVIEEMIEGLEEDEITSFYARYIADPEADETQIEEFLSAIEGWDEWQKGEVYSAYFNRPKINTERAQKILEEVHTWENGDPQLEVYTCYFVRPDAFTAQVNKAMDIVGDPEYEVDCLQPPIFEFYSAYFIGPNVSTMYIKKIVADLKRIVNGPGDVEDDVCMGSLCKVL